MEKKEFYEYAVKSNLIGWQYKEDEVVKMRDNRLKAESAKVIEATNYIIENGFSKLKFEMCMNSHFYKYEYNWAQIFIPQLRLYLFFVDNDENRDIIFQLYGRCGNMLIFDMDVDMEIGPTPYAHLSPLGHELVNLLPATVRR